MDKKVAEETSIIALKIGAMLNNQLTKIQETCDKQEAQRYTKGTGYVLGYLLTEIMNPIYKEHPDLKPKQMDGPYEIDPEIYENM